MGGGPLRLDGRVRGRHLLGERRLARLVARQLDDHAVDHRARLAGELGEIGADPRLPAPARTKGSAPGSPPSARSRWTAKGAAPSGSRRTRVGRDERTAMVR